MHDDGSGVYSGAYVYFMNPEWRLHWGGLLLLMEGEGNRLLYEHRAEVDQIDFYRRKWLHMNQMDALLMEHGFARCIFPKRNRIVFIANNAYHMVTRVNEAAGDHLRMSIAGFYNRKK
jgi:Rps23 Pro-64 3,4-dihydroxylase Tpa1-like proline 4-hydroxylase